MSTRRMVLASMAAAMVGARMPLVTALTKRGRWGKRVPTVQTALPGPGGRMYLPLPLPGMDA